MFGVTIEMLQREREQLLINNHQAVAEQRAIISQKVNKQQSASEDFFKPMFGR